MQDYKKILREVKQKYSNILGTNLVGIYVHGSIAFGCFQWDMSDIDYLVVVHDPLSLDQKRQIMEETVAINEWSPPKGLEMSIVLEKYCRNFVYPTPYELHFSNSHLTWYLSAPEDYCKNMCGEDPDLAAHFTVIRYKGVVLCGDEIKTLFGPVDACYYIDSIKADIKDAKQDILDNPIYIILNLCRVLAYIEDGLILSKAEGAKWGLQNIPCEHRQLIQEAAECYLSIREPIMDQDQALKLCEYMLTRIQTE